MSDWNPELYLRFKNERTQPVLDLISRIGSLCPGRVLDIGCGPGNSTVELKKRWPQAEITGLDSSPAMIEKAKAARPDITWVLEDASANLSHLGNFDLIFSNAALQWMPDHEHLIQNLFSLLAPGGTLAVQIPLFENMAVARAIHETTSMPAWAGLFKDYRSPLTRNPDSVYYDILRSLTDDFSMWVTDYCHILSNHEAIVEWCRSTSLAPLLTHLGDEELQNAFIADLLPKLEQHYPSQSDGRVLFYFKRFFFTAVADAQGDLSSAGKPE